MKKFFQKSAVATAIALAGNMCMPSISMADDIPGLNIIYASNEVPMDIGPIRFMSEEGRQQLLRDHQMTPFYQAARNHWTIERIESAIPVELPQADGSSVRVFLDAEDFAGDWTPERIASSTRLFEVLSPDGFARRSVGGSAPAALEEQQVQTLEEYLFEALRQVAPDSLVRFWRAPEGFDPTVRDGGSAKAPIWTPELGEVDSSQYTTEEWAQIVGDYWASGQLQEVKPKEWPVIEVDGVLIQLL